MNTNPMNYGIIVGEQFTLGASWRIRMADELRVRFFENTLQGYVPILDPIRMLGVLRQTLLQRVKRGQLESLHVSRDRRKGLRVNVLDAKQSLVDMTSPEGV
jgi:hypothetical protein